MAKRKAGLPENHEIDVDLGSLTEPADIPDFLDSVPPPRPVVAPPPTPKPAPKTPKLEVVERPVELPAPPPRAVAAEPEALQQKGKGRLRHRPPRRELGFDDETLAMLKDLHVDGVSQSQEESLTRSEVARAALRAVHAARKLVDYSRIGPRGKWGTSTARGLVDDLTEQFIKAIGELYLERYKSEGGRV